MQKGGMNQEFWNDCFKEDPDSVHILDFVIENETGNLKPGRALDLGCGIGLNTLKLAGNGWSVMGVDWSEVAISLATESAARQKLDVSFEVSDVTSWKPPETYDLVITTYALPTGEDARTALRTAASALADGGVLLVVEWDVSMQKEWGFDDGDFMPLSDITETLSDLTIEKAEVRRISEMFSDPDDYRYSAGREANIAFVRARKVTGA